MNLFLRISVGVVLVMASSVVRAEDISVKVNFNGSFFNGPNRQSVFGSFTGNSIYEVGFLDFDANFSGSVESPDGTRKAEARLTGDYPTDIVVRLKYSGVSLSDTFRKTITVRRKSIVVADLGTIYLKRAIDPKRSGRQRISGSGVLRYNF